MENKISILKYPVSSLNNFYFPNSQVTLATMFVQVYLFQTPRPLFAHLYVFGQATICLYTARQLPPLFPSNPFHFPAGLSGARCLIFIFHKNKSNLPGRLQWWSYFKFPFRSLMFDLEQGCFSGSGKSPFNFAAFTVFLRRACKCEMQSQLLSYIIVFLINCCSVLISLCLVVAFANYFEFMYAPNRAEGTNWLVPVLISY